MPPPVRSCAERIEPFVEGALGRHLSPWNPLRTVLTTYWDLAGIEGGYGFFSPNVRGGFKLVFELQYPDGRVEYTLPRVNSTAAGLRVASLVDDIGREKYEPLREYLVKSMVQATWRDHPDATAIRAVFGMVELPGIDEFRQGKREEYLFLYAYDFRRGEPPSPPSR